MKKNAYSPLLLLFLLIAAMFTACRQGVNNSATDASFAIIAQDNSGSFNFIPLASITEGNISADGAGKGLTEYGDYFGNFFTAGSYLYTTMPGASEKLFKHRVTNNGFEKLAEVTLKGLMEGMWYNYDLTNTDTASFFGRSADARFLTYNQVDIKNMKLLNAGNLPLPLPDSTLNQEYIDHGICIIRQNKLYLTYCYCDKNWRYKDTTYLAEMDYPSLKNTKISKYTNIGFPLTYGAVPGAIINKNNDIFMAGGINDYGNQILPSGIHKIAENSDHFSASINAKEKLGAGYAVYGIWDLGNGKVLTRVAGPWFDEWVSDDNTYDLYTVELSSGKFSKLDIPRSVHLGNTILIKNGTVYIANNTDKQIYAYNIASGSITKGLRINNAKRLVGIYSLD